MSEPSGQQGQATPLVLVVLLFAAMVCVGVARVGSAAVHRAEAQTAADAAALAGALGGSHAAEAVAADNDAEVIRYRTDRDDVVVRIERDGITADARARSRVDPVIP